MKNFTKLLLSNIEIYEKFKSDFTYHSSNIEGSKISKEDNSILVSNITKTAKNSIMEQYEKDEIIENRNLGIIFDTMFKNYTSEFSIQELKEWHRILKTDTDWSVLYPNAVGKFRTVNIEVGDSINFAIDFKNINEQIFNLIADLNYIQNLTIKDIANLHCRFEQIHPFQDGNGRIGRMIMIKQCLKSLIPPFFINSITKNEYINCLKMFHKTLNDNFLTEYLIKQQQLFLNEYSIYLMEYSKKEKEIINYLMKNTEINRIMVEKILNIKPSTANLLLNKMIKNNLITKKDNGKNSYYVLKEYY
ncbi:MAG: Fic family protein [Mycoplasmataceae bacterium]|jgi:Fic family protein|nr:Fic family protein [Mycoplasmataceae bacterium]